MKLLVFDIGGTEMKYALCDENFILTDKKSVPTKAHEGGRRIIERVVEISGEKQGRTRRHADG